jgi:hypothetical protein
VLGDGQLNPESGAGGQDGRASEPQQALAGTDEQKSAAQRQGSAARAAGVAAAPDGVDTAPNDTGRTGACGATSLLPTILWNAGLFGSGRPPC